jgi:hypothetical protein
LDEDCLTDLRAGLCATHVDAAFVTDHPSHAATQDWQRLLLEREGDVAVTEGESVVGNRIVCDDGHQVLWMVGSEDALMPVAFDQPIADTVADRDALLSGSDAASIDAMKAAGATVLVAHPEGRTRASLEALQDLGLNGLEMFNLHAMFAPDIRVDDLGLDSMGWLVEIASFTSPDGTAEPDLLFLGVLQTQPPNLAHYDALMARGPVVGIGGTDAHQNVMNFDLRDGERGDSYRRMLRWFSNVLLVEDDSPAAWQAALEAGRNAIVFEAIGTPAGLDISLDDGLVHELGATTGPGTLTIGCVGLTDASPKGEVDPEIRYTLLKNGVEVGSGCGAHEVIEPGVYRVEIWMTPHHLEPFLGTDATPWIKPYPWVLSNGFRVGL